MFSKKIILQPPIEKHIPYEKEVHIHEHKAPTDESIKLYDELREKAIKSITGRFEVRDAEISGVAISFEEDDFSQTVRLLITSKINGNNVVFAHDVHRPGMMAKQLWQKKKKEIIMSEIKTALTEFVVAEIIKHIHIQEIQL